MECVGVVECLQLLLQEGDLVLDLNGFLVAVFLQFCLDLSDFRLKFRVGVAALLRSCS